uniref:Uncharacterized protein n=1 Tax=Lepeophtheirus salmonis TaxID=72036 RepID=A0A0K2SZQ9_LEPSM
MYLTEKSLILITFISWTL